MFNHVSDSVLDQEQASVVPQRRCSLSNRGRALVAAVAACASLVGCASTTDVVTTDKPGTYTVAASATGGEMALARPPRKGGNKAADLRARRGLQSRLKH